jgi:TRAP transporter TAXI family solute receptor
MGRLGRRVGAFIILCMAFGDIHGFAATPPQSSPLRFVRIGTGPTGGTYFPIGGLIANAISNPPGSAECDLGGSCGVPGLIAAAVATQGSVDNVKRLAEGSLDFAISQANVALDAFAGRSEFAGKQQLADLRAIGVLFPEAVHVVVRADARISAIGALRGKRVSVGEPRSGTFTTAETILSAFGLRTKDLTASYSKLARAGEELRAGRIDGFFMVAGYPVEAIATLAESMPIALVPITGKAAESVTKREPILTPTMIPGGIYKDVPATPTLGVPALLVVDAKTDEALVYAVTKALWDQRNQRVLRSGHPEGRNIRIERSLDGLTIPLHPGAARFYQEAKKG